MDSRHNTSQVENGFQARRLEAGLECTLRDSLVSLGLFSLMLLLAISHPIFLPPEIAPTMTVSAAVCALFFLTVYLLVRSRRVSERLTNPLGLAGGVLLSLNRLLHLYLSGDPAQTTNMALVLIGAGIFSGALRLHSGRSRLAEGNRSQPSALSLSSFDCAAQNAAPLRTK